MSPWLLTLGGFAGAACRAVDGLSHAAQAVAGQVPAREVSATGTTHGELIIGVVNSPWEALPDSTRSRSSERLAALAAEAARAEGYAPTSVRIEFRRRATIGGVGQTTTMVTYVFPSQQ